MSHRGSFKGKEITFAPTGRIEDHQDLSQEFMTEVFGLSSGEYLLTDESDVRDFTEFGSSDTSDIWRRIQESFGVAATAAASGKLVDILDAISRSRRMQ